MRLNKYLASQLNVGRRQIDNLIDSGKITVNYLPARLGQQISPETDQITVEGKRLISSNIEYVYVLINKPVGYVCSRRSQGKNPTIYELLPEKYHHLKSAGRLDKDSSGLILLTNDGQYANSLMHPSFEKSKVYKVTLDKELSQTHKEHIEKGVILNDGTSRLELESIDKNRKNWRVTMHEGRNRQIRRTFTSLGYEVLSLIRTAINDYSLDYLGNRDYLEITPPGKKIVVKK